MLPAAALGKWRRPLRGLPRIAPSIQQPPREGLFENLHHRRWIAAPGFAEQKMNVFGHDNISNHNEAVAPTDLLHDFKKQVAMLRRVEQRPSLETTCGDEVKISGAVVTVQIGRHRQSLPRNVKRCL